MRVPICSQRKKRRLTVVFRLQRGQEHADRRENWFRRIVKMDLYLDFKVALPVRVASQELTICRIVKLYGRSVHARDRIESDKGFGVLERRHVRLRYDAVLSQHVAEFIEQMIVGKCGLPKARSQSHGLRTTLTAHLTRPREQDTRDGCY